MKFIDTHCHLNDTGRIPNTAEEVAAALEAGVDRLIVVGIDREWSTTALAQAEQFPGVFAACGWHPTSVGEYDPSQLPWLRECLAHTKCVALGEIGLDYYWDKTTPGDQKAALSDQLDLAQEVGCPVIFHCREAYDDLLDILEHRGPGPYLLHCFAGDITHAGRGLALGCTFGVDGPVTYKKADDLREVVRFIGLEQLVLETDAPWLTPEPYRGKPNRPAYIPHIAQGVAHCLGVSLEEVAAKTTANAERFFRL